MKTPGVIIKNRKDTDFSYADVVALLHLAFEERWRQGLHFSCAKMTAEEFEADTKVCELFVAVDRESGRLIGHSAIRIYRKPDKPVYGLFEYLAVHPDAARQGIASRLLNTCIDYCLSQGAEFILSDTATRAKSSVKFHFKNGFQLADIYSYHQTNYLSFVFKRPCQASNPHSIIWKSRYFFAYVKLLLLYNDDGSSTAIARFISKLKSHK